LVLDIPANGHKPGSRDEYRADFLAIFALDLHLSIPTDPHQFGQASWGPDADRRAKLLRWKGPFWAPIHSWRLRHCRAGDQGACDCSNYEEFGIHCIAPRYAWS